MYYNKYLKYKSKYLSSLNMKGGTYIKVVISGLSGEIADYDYDDVK